MLYGVEMRGTFKDIENAFTLIADAVWKFAKLKFLFSQVALKAGAFYFNYFLHISENRRRCCPRFVGLFFRLSITRIAH